MPPPLELSPEVTSLEAYRAQTDRLRILLAFLLSPAQAPKDEDGRCDDDVVAAYNIMVAATLRHATALIDLEHRGRLVNVQVPPPPPWRQG